MSEPNGTPPLREGETVILVDSRERRYLLRLKAGGSFHFHRGVVSHKALVGLAEGALVRSSLGASLRAVRPTLAEYVLEMPRACQIIYPKDLGLILIWADVYPGAVVLEAGIGAGALTLALLRAVGPEGRVISYETRPEFAQQALGNIERFLGRVPPNLEVRLRDIYAGIEEQRLDRILMDVPEPWRVVPWAAEALRPGGIFLAYVPTTIQVQQVVEALRGREEFGLIETLEAFLRLWNIRGLSVRPAHRMVAHTGFITTARRLAAETGAPLPRAQEEPMPPEGGLIDQMD